MSDRASKIDSDRWNSYMFELEKIAAALHITGLDYQHYIEMCTLAWNITGQSVDLTLVDRNAKEKAS